MRFGNKKGMQRVWGTKRKENQCEWRKGTRKSERERKRERKRKRDLSLYERSEFKLLFHLPTPFLPASSFLPWLLLSRAGEVFIPYKSQYPLVSAARKKEESKVAVANGIWKYLAGTGVFSRRLFVPRGCTNLAVAKLCSSRVGSASFQSKIVVVVRDGNYVFSSTVANPIRDIFFPQIGTTHKRIDRFDKSSERLYDGTTTAVRYVGNAKSSSKERTPAATR